MAILVTVPRQTRQGVYTSPSVQLPPTLSELLVKLNVTNATYNQAGKSVTIRLYYLDDLAAVWRLAGVSTWETGPYTDPETGDVNPAPVLSLGLDNVRGRLVRAEIEIPLSLSVGATVETA